MPANYWDHWTCRLVKVTTLWQAKWAWTASCLEELLLDQRCTSHPPRGKKGGWMKQGWACLKGKGHSCPLCQSTWIPPPWGRRPVLFFPNPESVSDSALRQKCPTVPHPSFCNNWKCLQRWKSKHLNKKKTHNKNMLFVTYMWIWTLFLKEKIMIIKNKINKVSKVCLCLRY